jgi:DNA polymerase-4
MSTYKALRLCPQLIVVPGRFEAYKEVSRQIRAIFADYTSLIEPLSLDEAYLDVTGQDRTNPSATLIAYEIKQRILRETGLTASAGVSYNKFLAKVASDHNKPNGLCVIPPHKAQRFIDELPIGRFYGIGQKNRAQAEGHEYPHRGPSQSAEYPGAGGPLREKRRFLLPLGTGER